MKKSGGALVLVLALGLIGGYVGLNYTMSRLAPRLLAQLEASMPAGYALAHGGVEGALLTPEIVVRDLVVTAGGQPVFTAGEMRLYGWPGFGGQLVSLWSVSLENLAWRSGPAATAASLRLDRPGLNVVSELLAGRSPLSESQLSFAGGEIAGVQIGAPGLSASADLILLGPMTNNRLEYLSISRAALANQQKGASYRTASFETFRIQGVSLAALLNLPDPDPAVLLAETIDSFYLKNGALTMLDENGRPTNVRLAEGSLGDIIRRDNLPVGGRLMLTGLGSSDPAVPAAAPAPAASPPASKPVPADSLADPDHSPADPAAPVAGGPAPGGKAPSTALNVDMTVKVDPEAKTLHIRKFRLDAPNVGALDLTADLTTIPWPPQLGLNFMSWTGASLAGIELNYTDAGYIESQIRKQLATSGQTREAWLEAVARDMDAAGISKGPALAPVVRALLAFLAKPNRLIAVARPEQPVMLMQLLFARANPEPVAAQLKLFVTAQ